MEILKNSDIIISPVMELNSCNFETRDMIELTLVLKEISHERSKVITP